jgi:signal transduction histidine kinase
MDVSKIDEGRFDFEPKPARLENLITESINELMPFAEKNKISLLYENPSRPLPKVKIDSQRIKQALQNLIDNAIKYSVSDSRGRVIVKVQKDKFGKFLKTTVMDNGAGIPKDEQKKMFQRFFRASNVGRLDPGGGTGLGLFIVKTIIDGHGGKIWFKSGGKGKGATFYFTLPTIKQKKSQKLTTSLLKSPSPR